MMKVFELKTRAGVVNTCLQATQFVHNLDRLWRFCARKALFVVLLALCSTLLAADTPTEISSLSQFYALSSEQSAKNLPIRVRATVLCYDSGWSQLYIQDAHTCSYIRPNASWVKLRQGQYVELTGQTTQSQNGSGWTNLNIAVLGEISLPLARPLTLNKLTEQYGQWVEVRGEVRSAETSRGRLCLTLMEGGVRCRAYVLGKPQENYRELVGCRVRVHGINTSQIANGRVVSGLIIINDLKDVITDQRPPSDFLASPVISIDALFDRELGAWTNRPVHLNGLIIGYSPGDFVIVKDPTGVIRARVSQATRTAPEERVNLWGFLEVSAHGVELADGYFETLARGIQQSETTAPAIGEMKDTAAAAPLTESRQVTRLNRSEAARRLPVKLRGVVTYTDPDWETGFLQDSTGAVFFNLGQRDIKPGQWVELTGFTDPGGFAPLIINASARILGSTNPPTATHVDLDDLNNGQLDCHWVEMEGVVRRVEGDGFHVFLSLMSSKGAFKAVVSDCSGRSLPIQLVDCLVRLRGVSCSEINERRQLIGFSLDVPGLQELTVVEPAPADPFSIPPTSSRAVGQFDSGRLVDRRVKVAGTVSLVLPGEGFFLQDDSGGIRVRTAQTNEVHLGQRVEVLGFPAIGDFAPRLDEAAFREGGIGSLPAARPTTAEEILARASEDSMRVQIQGQLLQRVSASAHPKLVLQSGSVIFTARIMEQGSMRSLLKLRPGSMVRVTGVCSLQAGESRQAEAMRLLVARPEAIEFLSAPPLWTERDAIKGLGIIAVTVVAVLVWITSLRRQVRNKTAVVHEEKTLLATLIDHLPDNVYVKDVWGRYILSNQAHARFHGAASPAVFRGKSGKDVFPPDVARLYAEADAKVLEGDIDIFSREERVFNGAGQERQLLTTKVPLRDQQGRIVGLVGFSRDVTEARRAEAELVEKERALSTLMSNLPGLAYRCRNDEQRTMEFLSEGCLALTGYSPAELLVAGGISYAQLIHRDDRARVLEAIQQAVQLKTKFQVLYRIVHKDGAERWVWEQGLGVCSASGEVRALEGFAIDITERRRADEALRISEERFRAVWEHSMDGMSLTDSEGRLIAVNQAFCNLVKQQREKLVGQLFTAAYSSEGQTDALENYKERFQSGKIVPRAATRMKCPNGEEKDLELSNCFVELGQGGRAVFSILRDISERRRVESILAYERDLLSTLFENLPDSLYFKDLQSRFVRVSRSKLDSSWAMARARHRFSLHAADGTAVTGSEAQQTAEPAFPEHLASRGAFEEYIIGKTDFDFFDEPRARAAFEDEQEILRTCEPIIGKVEQTNHLDGRVTWSLTTKMPWRDKDGRLIGTFGVSKDITSIKEAESSVELVHKQLLETSRQAGMAEVATGVLHNVGNVLNSVNVSATLLAEKLRQSRVSSLSKVAVLVAEHSADLGDFMTKDPRGRQLPSYLAQLADRLAVEQTALLDEVGCLAKNVEHIKSVVAMQQSYARPSGITESVQAVEVMEDALRINNGSLVKHEVQVLRQYQPDLPVLTIDKHKVLQILVNLVSNAGHACAQSKRSDKQVTVRLAATEQRLSISISDNGVGIAPENLTRVFNLGFTTRHDGHGFGLHSGALAAREIGGTLVSHSDGPGTGATFVLELPLTPSA